MMQYLPSLATLTLFVLMMSLGINVTIPEITSLLKDKKILINSLIAADILVPLVGLFLVLFLNLPTTVKIAILLMAACPGAPMITRKAVKAGNSLNFALSLQLLVTILAVITTPITIALFSKIYDGTASVSPVAVGKSVFAAQLFPIAIGIFLNEKQPNFANKSREPLTKIANGLFLLLAVIILVIALKALSQTTFLSLLVMIIIAIASLAIGHFFGGEKLETRQSLAITCATRNAGLALFVGTLNFPEPEMKTELFFAIIAYALMAAIMTVVYLKWSKKQISNQA